MNTARITLESISPYSQSRSYSKEIEKLPKETANDYETRTWRNRLHVNDEGRVCIPPMAIKNCLAEAAKYLSMQIPGKGKSTYTKHFLAGLIVVDPIVLPIRAADVKGEWLFLPADGIRGSGRRVWKCYPLIGSWSGSIDVSIVDPIITADVFRQHILEAGKLVGIGRFRPACGGFYGRFKLVDMKWS